MVCQKEGKKIQRDFLENKKRLLELAKGRGRILVLVDPPPPPGKPIIEASK
jgi:hypothetical protein